MTGRLDPMVRVGHRVFAALTQVEITAHNAGPVVMATANKQPLAILMLDGDTVTALGLDGRARTPKETARLYHEAVAQLRALQADAPDARPPAQ